MQGMSSFAARSASRTAWWTVRRSTPGIEATGVRVLVPSTTNIGQIRSSVVSTFSRTSRRAHSALRLRRGGGRGGGGGGGEGGGRRGGRGGGEGGLPPRCVAHFDRTPEFDRHVMGTPEGAGQSGFVPVLAP